MHDLNKSTYNKIANDWHNDHTDDTWWMEGTDKFISLLPPGGTVLDVGCGGGYKSEYFKKRGFRVTGIDFSEEMIKLARKQVAGPDFRVLDLYDIDKLEMQFDAVFVQAVLLHVPKADVVAVLTKLKDRVVSQGHLYLAVKHIRPDGKEEEIVTENDYGYDYQRFFSYFTTEEIIGLLTQLGLEPVYENISATKSGKTNWIQIIAKKND